MNDDLTDGLTDVSDDLTDEDRAALLAPLTMPGGYHRELTEAENYELVRRVTKIRADAVAAVEAELTMCEQAKTNALRVLRDERNLRLAAEAARADAITAALKPFEELDDDWAEDMRLQRGSVGACRSELRYAIAQVKETTNDQ